MARVSRSHDESSNNNDNRVILMDSETEEGPLIQCTLHDTAEETPCSGGTMNPVGAENGMRIYEKK